MFLPSAYLRSNGFGASGSTSHTYCDTADSLEEEYSFTLFNGDGEVAKVVVGGYVESAVQLHMRAAPSDVVGAILLMVSPQVRGGAAPQLALLEIGCEVKGSKEMEKRSYTLRLRKLSSTTLEGARYLHFVDGTYHPSHVELLFSAAATGESFLTSAIHSVTVLLAGQEETAGPIGPLTSLAPPTTYTTSRVGVVGLSPAEAARLRCV
ncbi:hypothetical protein AGDE_13578 [Angomonas deanei]|uniref:Uncharacterized protein n=1 Tax=Angomonas deanei TaxID=59799 RepID=A0A7G2CH64_9TRYP|nr:hypothetical protein AGDE_13578 [Angomonas deanei]CAD2218377.1 hypothetical protein, conserved [Angomonas deanei]|eukprot:EPY22152.1 hypothetical protein AGDE_13578 [Angomonas deanei]